MLGGSTICTEICMSGAWIGMAKRLKEGVTLRALQKETGESFAEELGTASQRAAVLLTAIAPAQKAGVIISASE